MSKERDIYLGVDDTELDKLQDLKPSNKTEQEIDEDLAHAILDSGVMDGKTYEEILQYVKEM
jgi:hypothetical protein